MTKTKYICRWCQRNPTDQSYCPCRECADARKEPLPSVIRIGECVELATPPARKKK